MCATQQWKGGNLLEKENFNRAYKLGSQAELSRFATNFNLCKSEHDFVFRSWGKTLGCV